MIEKEGENDGYLVRDVIDESQIVIRVVVADVNVRPLISRNQKCHDDVYIVMGV
jgi:hypothetical protein